jgi:hypothetical protein
LVVKAKGQQRKVNDRRDRKPQRLHSPKSPKNSVRIDLVGNLCLLSVALTDTDLAWNLCLLSVALIDIDFSVEFTSVERGSNRHRFSKGLGPI